MRYQVVFKPSFFKEIEKLPRPIRLRCDLIIEDIRADPFDVTAKKLGGYEGLYRHRIGDYRLVYYVNQRERKITLLFVGHRKDIYRQLKQYQ